MSFYTSLTGLNAATAQLGVTSNNIANVGTTGFKRSRADFGDIFATSPLQKASSTIGQGVALKQVTQEFGQGNVAFSANALDLAITGDGFFPLKSADGLQDIYTRNGSFMMNDQYNVVNSAGQRLMAASVDSSGKADLGNLNVLTIPQQTNGEAAETSLINLGLNFPADAKVITEPFSRNNPETYNKSTALTVYDSGGNGYLATVYYAKTQNASQLSPTNKWQTYVFVGDTQVNPSLIQATDDNAEALYVNKYGEIKPESEVSDFLVNGKTQMFSLDDLTDQRVSQPAAVTGQQSQFDLTADTTYSFANVSADDLKNMFTIDVDGSGNAVTVDLSDLASTETTMTGVAIAKELTNRLNAAFGDERYFDFTGNTKFQINATVGGVNKTTNVDLADIGMFKQERLSFSAPTITSGTTDISVAGVAVTVAAGDTAAEVAAKVKAALEADAFITGTDGRSVTDNANGTLTLSWAASDEAIDDVVLVDKTGVTATASVETAYAATPKATTLTFGAATSAGDITVAGVAVTVVAGDTADQVATKVKTALDADAFITGTAGRSVTDNADGSITVNWVMADADATDPTFVDTGTTGVTQTAAVETAYASAAKETKLTMSPATADGIVQVAGVRVDVAAGDTAIQVATKVKAALDADAFVTGTTRTITDNADGSITVNWALADADAADPGFEDGTGVNASTSVETFYIEGFTDIEKVTKSAAVDAMQTLINAQGLTSITVGFDQVNGGFTFTEANDGEISLQAPQSAKSFAFNGNAIATDDSLSLQMVRNGVTTTLQATGLPAGASLDEVVAKFQGQSAYGTSGYTIDNVDGELRIARNDGTAFTVAAVIPTDGAFAGSLTDAATSASAVGATATSVVASSVTGNAVLGLAQTSAIVGEGGLYVPVGSGLNGKVMPNGDLIRPLSEQRFGLKVGFDNVNERFTFSSGSTGDSSSITISGTNSLAESLLGLSAPVGTPIEVATSDVALRGTTSSPAQTVGTQVAINVNNNFSVDNTNNTFVVSVDDVKGTVSLPPSDAYTLDGFMAALEKEINGLASTTGSTVSGVKVSYDRALNAFQFTTGTTGTDSFIKVSGSSNWGLANVEAGRGSTSTWIKPTQFTDFSSGVGVSKYIDEFGSETSSADGFESLPEWSPIYLDKGELTFNTSGNLISPQTGSQLDTVYLADGKGALTINIDYSASTQYSSAFAVLSQSQDGRPEGDLVGLDIGDDGLVSASYSNGTQLTLAKVILSNFSSPAGLRQIGDSSFYATAKSGDPKIGEAGSAGFGTIRAGATERANVDLTQELVDLITAQRNFQANSKAIETSSTMTQAIINIRS
ncbi:flagellar hook-basal body complex protein [Comamonadaceae bacterium M7527]|nr:flagellar hook-basal body complex protein [Comamonadaceae bacterium M7527]